MLRFAVRRLINMAFVLVAISIVTFLIFYVFPGTNTTAQVQRIAGRSANEATRAQVRRDYGFDRPIYVQYSRLMGKIADGSLISYSNQTNVRDEIVRGIPRHRVAGHRRRRHLDVLRRALRRPQRGLRDPLAGPRADGARR